MYRIDLLTTLFENSACLTIDTANCEDLETIRYRYLNSSSCTYIYMHNALSDGNANDGNRMLDPPAAWITRHYYSSERPSRWTLGTSVLSTNSSTNSIVLRYKTLLNINYKKIEEENQSESRQKKEKMYSINILKKKGVLIIQISRYWDRERVVK